MKSAIASLQARVHLSPAEKRLLDLLPTDGSRINTEELRRKIYRGEEQPYHARIVVSGLVRNLVAKTQSLRGAPVHVCRSERRGPHPIEVWLKERGANASKSK